MIDIGKWKNTQNIIIENRHGIGDVLHMAWMIIYLRRIFPTARIDMILPKESYRDIFNSEGLIDKLFFWDEFNGGRDIKKLIKLRKNKYDLGFVAVNSTKSLAVGLLKLIGCRKIIVELNSNSILRYIHGIYGVWGNNRSNRILRNVNLLSPICSVEYKFDDFLKWEISHIYLEKSNIKTNQKKIALFIGTNPNTVKIKGKKHYYDIKKWGYDKFSKLAKKITDDGMLAIILGGEKEFEESKGYFDNEYDVHKDNIINLCGKTTISQMKEIFLWADVVVACDTGPMHIAASLGKKVIAIFGPTNPDVYVIPDSNVIVATKGLSCQYCHDSDEGFHCGNMKCLKEISVDRIFETVKEIINNEENKSNGK